MITGQFKEARTGNFSVAAGGFKYFAPDSTGADSQNIGQDPTDRSFGNLRCTNRVPNGNTLVHRGFEIELESAVPAGGTLEVELIVDGQTTGVMASIAAGQVIGSDFAATQQIAGGQLYCYRFYPIGFTNCPGSTITAIVERV